MDLEKFKILNDKYTKAEIPFEKMEGAEYEEYCNSLENDKECINWFFINILEKRKFNYSKHCCLEMSYHLSKANNDKNDWYNPDIIIKYFDSIGHYGIPITDGGRSMVRIKFCPWCGNGLTNKNQRIE